LLQNIFQRSISLRDFWILTQAALVLFDTQKYRECGSLVSLVVRDIKYESVSWFRSWNR